MNKPSSCLKRISNFNRIPKEQHHIHAKDYENTILGLLAEQKHDGLIIKKIDPIMTLLRSRPRNYKSYERLITLEGADPLMIEQILENRWNKKRGKKYRYASAS